MISSGDCRARLRVRTESAATGRRAQGRPADRAPAISDPPGELDRDDLELIQIVLNEPTALTLLIPRVAVDSLKDASLQDDPSGVLRFATRRLITQLR